MVIVYDFWAPWCGPCKPISVQLDQLAEKYKGKLELRKVNIEELGDLAQDFGVSSLPTVMVQPGDDIVATFTGSTAGDKLKTWLEANIN
jgi:thioredoxin